MTARFPSVRRLVMTGFESSRVDAGPAAIDTGVIQKPFAAPDLLRAVAALLQR